MSVVKCNDNDYKLDINNDVIVGENVIIHKVKTDNNGDDVTGVLSKEEYDRRIEF